MKHWNYLTTISAINKGLLNKKCQSLTFIKIANLGKFDKCCSCYSKLEQHWIKYCVFIFALLSSIWVTKISALSIAVASHKYSLTVTWYTFRSVKIRTLTSSSSKYQTNGKFKLLDHNCNHQQGFLKQKIVALYCCDFNLKLPKLFLFWSLLWVNIFDEIVVTEN